MKQYEIRIEWLREPSTEAIPSVGLGLRRTRPYATRLYLIPEEGLVEETELEALTSPSELFFGDETEFDDGSASFTLTRGADGALLLRITYAEGEKRQGDRATHLVPLGGEFSYHIHQYESTMGDVYRECDESYRVTFALREGE